VTALERPVRFLERSQIEQLTIPALPVRHERFWETGPVQKKYASLVFPFWLAGTRSSDSAASGGIGQYTGSPVFLCAPHAGMRIARQPLALQRHSVADAQAGPAHQFRERSDAVPADRQRVVLVYARAVSVDVRGVRIVAYSVD